MLAVFLAEKVKQALVTAGVTSPDVTIEHAELKNGDYATGAALAHAKQAGLSRRDLAESIVDELRSSTLLGPTSIHRIEVAGPGFINFHLSSLAIWKTLENARAKQIEWGRNDTQKGKVVMMEYTDPNPFKEFHIGHLVPNTLGESTSRLFEFSGADVKRANYQGDVGIHVAKSLFIQMEKGITDPTIEDLASAYPEGSKRYDDDPAAKQAIDALNKKIYDNLSGQESDPSINSLYEKGRSLSLAHFEELYKVLGTKFDFYFFESETGPRGLEIVNKHPEIFEASEGAVVFKGEKYGLHTRVFINKLGLPTYEAKELGLAEMKKEKCKFDLTITVTANEQAEYFKVVMKAMELVLPELRGRLAFKTNGLLRFAEGKMSSRLGNIITGEALLSDLAERARERATQSRADDADALSQHIAVAAIKYQILKQGFGKDIIFNRERALSLEGDSGPYLQYAYARANAIIEKAHQAGVAARFDEHVHPSRVSRLLYRFPEIVAHAQASLEPHTVANYLITIASSFNAWYAQEQILDGTHAASHKVALADAVRITLKNGLWILGIPAPERM